MPAASMVPDVFAVGGVTKETADTWTLELKPSAGNAFRFAPGAFNMVYVFGTGEIPLSISGDPSKPEQLVHTIRSVGAVSQKISQLKTGERLGVRGPFGSSWPLETAQGKDLLLVAGGLGIAPLRPVIYHALAHRQSYGRILLIYGTRTPAEIIYRDELTAWQHKEDIDVEITLTRAGPEWHGHVGVVTTLIPEARMVPSRTVAMVCGSEVLMRSTVNQLLNYDFSPGNIFISMERNMKCALGFCGHCQFGPHFICKNGPIFRYDHIRHFFETREI